MLRQAASRATKQGLANNQAAIDYHNSGGRGPRRQQEGPRMTNEEKMAFARVAYSVGKAVVKSQANKGGGGGGAR